MYLKAMTLNYDNYTPKVVSPKDLQIVNTIAGKQIRIKRDCFIKKNSLKCIAYLMDETFIVKKVTYHVHLSCGYMETELVEEGDEVVGFTLHFDNFGHNGLFTNMEFTSVRQMNNYLNVI